MKKVEMKSEINIESIGKRFFYKFSSMLKTKGLDHDEEIEVDLTATLMPFEPQTMLDEGCPAHLDDFCVSYGDLDLTEMIEKKSMENLEVEFIDYLRDLENEKY